VNTESFFCSALDDQACLYSKLRVLGMIQELSRPLKEHYVK
jgi:hypothetical protein